MVKILYYQKAIPLEGEGEAFMKKSHIVLALSVLLLTGCASLSSHRHCVESYQTTTMVNIPICTVYGGCVRGIDAPMVNTVCVRYECDPGYRMGDEKKCVAEDADQTTLAKTVAEDADQTTLAKTAAENGKASVRKAAVNKLTDQTVLAKIASEDVDWAVRQAAVNKLTDQTTLAKIAAEDADWMVRKAAVNKLNDQTILAKIAAEDADSDVREAAQKRLDRFSVKR
jgi:hypothetical protein